MDDEVNETDEIENTEENEFESTALNQVTNKYLLQKLGKKRQTLQMLQINVLWIILILKNKIPKKKMIQEKSFC